MATPTSNFVPTTAINPLAMGGGRHLASGDKWGGALGAGVTLTYSFPGSTAHHTTPYGEYQDAGEWRAYSSLSTGEKAAVKTALAAWSAVANIKFVEVAESSSTVGELRFAYTNFDSAYEYAHAYLPSNDPAAGDVWLSYQNWNPYSAAAIPAGSEDFHTLVHEIGHALGLKHSFEAPNPIPAAYDNYFYSVMSYSARTAGDSGVASFFPTTPMYYDLLAIQSLYGRNTQHNATNTTYTFTQGKTYFQTIDDAGGIDTIAFSGTRGVTINLNAGTFSSLSKPVTFNGGTSSSRNTVAIGPGSIIEKAAGGSGSDVVHGNSAANTLSGMDGNDVLYGNAGNDVLSGGNGNDRLLGGLGNDVLYGGAGSDTFFFNTQLSGLYNADRIGDFNAAADQFMIDNAVFSRLANGALNPAMFVTAAAARDANDYIVYDKARGILSYDADGSGSGTAIKFATVAANTVMTAADFIVI